MDYNPELEKAEADLQEQFRRARETKTGRIYPAWTGAVIFFAAIMHFFSAGFSVLMFFVAPFLAVRAGGANAWLVVWICSLPSAAISLGIACALERVLDLASPARPPDPDNLCPMRVQ